MSEDLDPATLKIDLTYLNDIAGGDAEFMIDMIDIFIDQTPIYVEQLIDAIAQKNWKAVGDIAHKIKPTLAFMGVDNAKDKMGEIEHNARSQTNLENIADEFAEIKALCANLYIGLEKVKAELQATL